MNRFDFRRRTVARLMACAALGMAATPLLAADDAWPNKPIRVIVPFTAGGGTDQLARIIFEPMQRRLGQPLIIDNRAGGGTIIGTKAVIAAPPDGYTLLMTTNASFTIIPQITKPVPYVVADSLEMISLVGESPMVFTVNTSMPTTFPQFLAMAKQKPGQLTFASSGLGTATHMAGELLTKETGMKMVHVPYKGGADASTALAGGHVNSMVDGLNLAVPLIKAGRVVPLVVLQAERSSFLPDTPSLKEVGFPNASLSAISFILAAPKGTSPQIVARLSAAVDEALKEKKVIDAMASLQTAAIGRGPAATTDFVRKQAASYQDIIVDNKIQMLGN
jgi:tripartite-type tricarboxylate transporter receptor subunit TctC